MPDAGINTLAMTQGIAMWLALMPRYMEAVETDNGTPKAGAVRHAELAATVATVGVGILLASLAGNAMPIKLAIIISFGFALMYEVALRSNTKGAE